MSFACWWAGSPYRVCWPVCYLAPLAWSGLAIAAVAMISTLTLAFSAVSILLPLARACLARHSLVQPPRDRARNAHPTRPEEQKLIAMIDARSTEQRIADTRRRLEDDKDAWVASTNRDRPWLIPLSYLWHEEQLVFATNGSTPTFTNLAASTNLRIALGTPRDVVILDGQASAASASSFTAAEIAAYQAKLGSNPQQWADSVIRLRPTRVQAWRESNELAGRVLMKKGVWVQ